MHEGHKKFIHYFVCKNNRGMLKLLCSRDDNIKASVEEAECENVSIIWFLSVKNSFILYLMHYSGNMFRLTIESSSGPYIKIQILNLP